MTSLRRTEAEVRARHLAVRHTSVDLDLTTDGETFLATTAISFDLRSGEAPVDGIFIDFKGRRLLSATLNGRALDVGEWQDGRLPLRQLEQRNELVVSGVMAYSGDGEGLHRHVDPADGQTYLYAMSFLDAAPRWFACFDQPDLKSTYQLRVRTPREWSVVGNGPSLETRPGEWRITPEHPLSSYFVTLVAGPYASHTCEHDGITLGFHARASLADHLAAEREDLVAVTTSSFDYYHRVFGIRYPFGEYHQAFVPDFNAGAMENPGCVTLRDQLIFRARATATERASRAGTIAHELAHQWFGDLVTMTWWDDLWLNESFAEYLGHRCCAAVGRYPLWAEFGIVRKAWGAVADQSPSAHPVAGNGAMDAQAALQDFDGISYAKGAAVLRQLVAYLGDEVFFAGLRQHFADHAFGNANLADLLQAWTTAGAVDLDGWVSQWLTTTGMDRIDAEIDAAAVVVTKEPPAGGTARRTHTIDVAMFGSDGQEMPGLAGPARPQISLTHDPVRMSCPHPIDLAVPDAADQTWAKIRFGSDGWDRLARVLPHVDDASTQVVAYNAVRDAVRDGELDPEMALELICDSISQVTADVVVAAVLGFALTQLAGPYAVGADRQRRRSRVHAVARSILESSPPGSDRQLTAFRLFIRSHDDAGRLKRLYQEQDLPPGVELDLELRWAMVERLAALDPDPKALEQTLRSDRSSAAVIHAARARASLGTAEAKATAWELLMSPSDERAYVLYATAEAFFTTGPRDLLEPYVAQFFAEIGRSAEFRRGWALGEVALLAFPTPFASVDTLRLAEATCRQPQLSEVLRRSLVDGTDDLRRALASLQRSPRIITRVHEVTRLGCQEVTILLLLTRRRHEVLVIVRLMPYN